MSISSTNNKRIGIVYYSISGTTKLIAQKIAEGLKEQHYPVEIYNIKEIEDLNLLKEFDIIGFGCPVHFFSPALRMREFISRMPKMKEKPFFAFLMHGTYTGKASLILRKKLRRKLGREIGFHTFHGEDLYYGYLKKGFLASAYHPTSDELLEAKDFAYKIALLYENGSSFEYPTKIKEHLIYTLERFLSSKLLLKLVFSKTLKVKKDICTKCGICVKSCPEDNISVDSNGFPIFGSNCIGCLTCQTNCPVEAIRSYANWWFVKRFISYNVKKFLNDPEINKQKIKLLKGKIKRE